MDHILFRIHWGQTFKYHQVNVSRFDVEKSYWANTFLSDGKSKSNVECIGCVKNLILEANYADSELFLFNLFRPLNIFPRSKTKNSPLCEKICCDGWSSYATLKQINTWCAVVYAFHIILRFFTHLMIFFFLHIGLMFLPSFNMSEAPPL